MTTSLVTVTTIDPQPVVSIGGVLYPSSVVIRQVEQGPPGATSGDLNYVHDQMTSSATWVITHNLGKHPSVTVIDSSNALCEGHVAYDSLIQITVTFSAAFAGHAYLN